MLNWLTVGAIRGAAAAAGLEVERLELHTGSRRFQPALRVTLLPEVAADHITLLLRRPA